MLKQYDHIKLKSGEHAVIIEIWEEGVAYEADIEEALGEYRTETIQHSDIKSV